jgi:hypothetical protein
MTENEAIVSSLEIKVNKLISLHDKLKNDNQHLLSENEELRNSIKLREIELKDLQSRYEQMKLAKLLISGSEDSHEAKLKVNRIVREIDKCIALMNK